MGNLAERRLLVAWGGGGRHRPQFAGRTGFLAVNQLFLASGMIPKSGYRFSEKIMPPSIDSGRSRGQVKRRFQTLRDFRRWLNPSLAPSAFAPAVAPNSTT